jgi:hypothetical protein
VFELDVEGSDSYCYVPPTVLIFAPLPTLLGKEKRSPELTSSDRIQKWLPAVDTLRNLFYAPTVEMKITFELLRQGSLAG